MLFHLHLAIAIIHLKAKCFLKHWEAISLKCNHQEKQNTYLPVSVGK